MKQLELPITLQQAMDIIKSITERTLSNEDDAPTLFMFTPTGEIAIAIIEGQGANLARAIRMLVLEHEPQFAFLQIEGWGADPNLPENDPDYIRLSVNEITPSLLPPEKRIEIMILDGESRDAQNIAAGWIIRRQSDGTRKLEAMEGLTRTLSRFHPMFMAADLFRKMREGSAPIRDLVKDLDDEDLYRLAKSVAARMLEDGAGGTTQEWEVEQHKIFRANVSDIAKRFKS